MGSTPITDVSDTALWIAHHRSVETARPDALFKDPLAARLAGDRGKAIAESMPRSMVTAWAIVMRTCIIDDHIRTALHEGTDTILNLGAGLDTRPYRMELPGSLNWIEVDYPHVIEYKERLLASETPRCRLTRIKCDLSDDAARRRVLADANASAQKLLVLTEGLVPYLSSEQVATLADDLHALDRAKYWLVDYFRHSFSNTGSANSATGCEMLHSSSPRMTGSGFSRSTAGNAVKFAISPKKPSA